MDYLNYRGTYFSVFLLILYITASVQQQQVHPFRAAIVWQANSRESFVLQKDFLLRHILELQTVDSEINLIPLSTTFQDTSKFKKTDNDWFRKFAKLRFNPSIEHDNVIPDTVIKGAVKQHLNHNKTTNIAEILFLLVDDKTSVDDVNEVEKTLEIKKTFVIYASQKKIPKLWQKLATDDNHVLKLTGNEADERKLIELTYHDSRLACDTNFYWDDVRCTECTDICSMVTKSVSPRCKWECPYLDRSPSNSSATTMHHNETAVNDRKTLMVVIIIGSIAIVICFICCLVFGVKCHRVFCRRQINEETGLNATTQNATERDRFPVIETGDFETGEGTERNFDNSTGESAEENESSALLGPGEEDRANFSATDWERRSESGTSVGKHIQEPIEDPIKTHGETDPLKAGIVLKFRNAAELDANAHTFDDHLFKLHANRNGVEQTFVKKQSTDQ